MDFEEALRCEIPLAEAATYFLRLKSAAVETPDETGQLEGQFTAPVEQVLKLMTEMVENELATMYAYKAYGNSLRDLSHFSIADEFEEHASNELEHTDFLLRRMAVIGGPVELSDIPAPPATTDPNAIIETMVRMEQEGIEKWRALLAVLGDNPTKYKVEEFLARELEHLDELWQLRPYQGSAQPTAMMTRETVGGETPGSPPAVPDAEPAAQPADGAKMANGMMPPTPMPTLPPTGKGQNPIQATPPTPPAAAMGQHKMALALRPLPPGQGDALRKAFGNIEQSLQRKSQGALKKIAPEAEGVFSRGRGSVPKLKAAEAFKLALEQLDGLVEGAPGPEALGQSPASNTQAYLDGEQEAVAGQEQNELAFYRQRMQEALAQLDQQKQQAAQSEAQVADLTQQVESAQAQQAQYQQMVSSATQESVAAKDEVLHEQQASAAMRMAYQQLRGQLLNVASQEPPSTEMLGEQAAMAGGAAGGAVQDPMAQGGQPPAGAPPEGSPAPGGAPAPAEPAAPAGGQDPTMQKAKPPAEAAAPKTASILDEVKKRAPYAVAGAALGAGAETAYKHKSSDPLREKVDRLSKEPEGGFGKAMNLAQAKARLAIADAVDKHPKASLLSGMALGGLEGAIGGPGVGANVQKGMKNLQTLRTPGG